MRKQYKNFYFSFKENFVYLFKTAHIAYSFLVERLKK